MTAKLPTPVKPLSSPLEQLIARVDTLCQSQIPPPSVKPTASNSSSSSLPSSLGQRLAKHAGQRDELGRRARARQWFAVRWDFTLAQFDLATLRHEPSQATSQAASDNPWFFRQPYLFPWIYLPADPWLVHRTPLAATVLRSRFQKLLGIFETVTPGSPSSRTGPASQDSLEPGSEFPVEIPSHIPQPVYAAIDWLNLQCHWQTHVTQIVAAVQQIGGVLIQHCQGGFIPDPDSMLPAPRYRKPLGGRPRNQPRASQRPHTGLRNAIRREQLASHGNRRPDPQSQPQQQTKPWQPQLQPLPATPNRHPVYQWTTRDVERYCQHHHLPESDCQELIELLGLYPPAESLSS